VCRSLVCKSLAVRVLAAVLVVPSTGIVAFADFRVCNRSQDAASVSFGYDDTPRGWTSQGWWDVPVGNCISIIRGNLAPRVYYIYATGPNGAAWEAPNTQVGGAFCISSLKYVAHNRDYLPGKNSNDINCQASGLQGRTFKQVDTGGQADFTVTLTHSGDDPPPPVQRTPAPPQPQDTPARSTPSGQTGAAGTACQRFPNLC
jgi:uncharacterized membrane protein